MLDDVVSTFLWLSGVKNNVEFVLPPSLTLPTKLCLTMLNVDESETLTLETHKWVEQPGISVGVSSHLASRKTLHQPSRYYKSPRHQVRSSRHHAKSPRQQPAAQYLRYYLLVVARSLVANLPGGDQ